MVDLLYRILSCVRNRASAIWRTLAPFAEVPPTLVDAVRNRREPLVESALLRHQLVVLRRRTPRPRLTPVDRLRLLLAARLLPRWRRAVALVQPETVLRWHRLGFRLFWRHKSKSCPRYQVTSDTVGLIREMAAKNRLWGAERIRGELLKIGVRVSKRTIQKYMRSCRRKPGGQTWSTFVKNHAQDVWSCDFVQSYDLLFRPVFLFFIVHLASRRVVHMAATRNPSQDWTGQQIRNATMDGAAPKFLIRDRDEKFGGTFDRVAKGAGIRVIKTAVRAPDMNAVAERFVGSLRREMLDHVLVIVLDDQHLAQLASEYVAFFQPSAPSPRELPAHSGRLCHGER